MCPPHVADAGARPLQDPIAGEPVVPTCLRFLEYVGRPSVGAEEPCREGTNKVRGCGIKDKMSGR